MNTTNLKRYAPEARKGFIAAVTARAHLLGLSEQAGKLHAEPCEVKGDVALIGGRPWPANVAGRRDALLKRMQREGLFHTLEAAAYTWFNRLVALRYMELHDYLGHGRRVLSNSEGGLPEVLTHALGLAESGELPGLLASKVRDLKLTNQDGELYRRVVIAQCNALHQAMPFLFEAVDDETELLLPDNLLLSDSIVGKLVAEIPEEDWVNVETIGWLYQFYISEKKDEVIGKVVKSEDIPAATQLFTPNWIVQYLVQNSVGRLWLMANPGSVLASEWPYYVPPAEQTPEIQPQLDALIQTRIRDDGETLNPETITVLDPACGSGHILVVAYDVLKAIYLERGYQPRAIPRLILEKNLYGLDIDDRAAQLAAFALLMKARADDRRLLDDTPKLNVLSLQESKGMDAEELTGHLAAFGLQRAGVKALVETFEHAKTFGSLNQIQARLNEQLEAMMPGLQQALNEGDLYARQAARDVLQLARQAWVLGKQFDAVVANPPYMGEKYYNPKLKSFVSDNYQLAKGDLYTCFILRNLKFAKSGGFAALITIPNWMFLSSFEKLRRALTKAVMIETLVHNGRGVFGSDFGSCSFVLRNSACLSHSGRYRRLFDRQGSVRGNEELEEEFRNRSDYVISLGTFEKIPGSTYSYWASKAVVDLFGSGTPVGSIVEAQKGLAPCDSKRFVRYLWEVSQDKIGLNADSCESAKSSGKKWFPFNKGGAFRKWYGNVEHVVNWEEDGRDIKRHISEQYPYLKGNTSFVTQNTSNYFRPSITWTYISSAKRAFRYSFGGEIPSNAAQSAFGGETDLKFLLGFLNTPLAEYQLALMSPTLNSNLGEFLSVAVPAVARRREVTALVDKLVSLYAADWALYQNSLSFSAPDFLQQDSRQISTVFARIQAGSENLRAEAVQLEQELNSIFLSNDFADLLPEEEEVRQDCVLRQHGPLQFAREVVEYAVGCMMGRYSLEEPGLIYAHAGNVGFDPSRYEKRFSADADGIVPLTDAPWFEDDAAIRLREFLGAVWGSDMVEENMAWLAESLGVKGSETPDGSIRRYLADRFFKDHLQTYKKRPIYWLFSSGKQGAFQALVYLHRYHEGTLARLRAEYVLPLTSKMQTRIESLEADARATSATTARAKLNKQLEALRKQQLELLAYDEKLRHSADMRITLDLDDGVKANYGKFGDLLAETKAVTGGTSDDD